MTSTITPQEAAEAAKKIMGFWPEIPASDPRAFAAGLVQTLLIFPRPVVERAVDPVTGIPSCVTSLNLARIRKALDEWADEYWEGVKRQERLDRKRIPEPKPDPEMQARVSKGLDELVAQLKRGLGPSTAG